MITLKGTLPRWTLIAAISLVGVADNTNLSKEHRMNPAPGADTYWFEMVTEGGPELGPGLHQTQGLLRVDLLSGDANEEIHQPPSDQGGDVIGVFRSRLAPDQLSKLRSVLEKGDWTARPSSALGGPGTSAIRFTVHRGGHPRSATYSSMDVATQVAFEPLIGEVGRVSAELRAHPWEALRLEIARGGSSKKSLVFRLIVKNVGMRPVAIVDPLELPSPPSEDSERPGSEFAGFRIAMFPQMPDDSTPPPLEWESIGLAGKRPSTPVARTRTIEAGDQLVFDSEPWHPTQRRVNHLVQALISAYQVSKKPSPARLIRGALFSEALEVTP